MDATEIKSIQLHDSIEGSVKNSILYYYYYYYYYY